MAQLMAQTTQILGLKALSNEPQANPEEIKKIYQKAAQDRVNAYNATVAAERKTLSGDRYLFDTIYNCPICKNKCHIAYLDQNMQEIMRECECCKKRSSMISAHKSGLGSLLKKKIKNYEATEDWQKNLKEKAIEFIRQPETDDFLGRGFAILGQSGSGKTHICAAICNYFISQSKTVSYLSWISDGDELKRLRLQETDTAYLQKMTRYKSTDVLYIDDLFKCKSIEKITDKDVKIAFEIINHRSCTPGSVTLISSEWTADILSEIDCALTGRINELCHGFLQQVPQGDKYNYRLKF